MKKCKIFGMFILRNSYSDLKSIFFMSLLLLSSCTYEATLTKKNLSANNAISIKTGDDFISLSQQSDIQFSGDCAEEGSLIEVYHENTNSIGQTFCHERAWSLITDLSNIADGTIRFSAQITLSSGAKKSTELLTIIKDTQPPMLSGSLMDGTYHNSITTSPIMNWTAAIDTGSGVEKYEIAIGTSLGATDELTWSSIGSLTSYQWNGLSLVNGQTYYPSLRAIDKAGNISTILNGDGWIVHLPPPAPSGLTLSNPTSSPNNNKKPSIKVSGITSGNSIKLYSDSACSLLVTTNIASGSSIILSSATNMSDGIYEFHAIQNDGIMDSVCSSSNVGYWLDSVNSEITIDAFYAKILEGSGNQSITLNVNPTKPYPITVKFNLTGTTADVTLHTLLPGNVIIPANTSSISVNYSILSDGLTKGDKILQFNIEKILPPTSTSNYLNMFRAYIDDLESSHLKVTQVAVGDSGVCALRENGSLKCWGEQLYIGDGTTNMYKVPTLAGNGVSYKQVALGALHTCAIDLSDHLWCWGYNSDGQLGDGTTSVRTSPVMIDSSNTYSQVSTNNSWHTCGVTTGGVLKCWGRNYTGQVGDSSTTQKNSPVTIDVGTTYSFVNAGISSTCGISTAGVLKCWGENMNGTLGDGTTIQRNIPTVIDAGTSYKHVSTGFRGTCGITTVNINKCWGTFVGNGTSGQQLLPIEIESGTIFLKIINGRDQKCGITNSNELKCWGANFSGTGTSSVTSTSPINIGGSLRFKDIGFGQGIWNNASCGITLDDELVCWGENLEYHIGDGNGGGAGVSSSAIGIPQLVDPFESFSDVVLGGNSGFLSNSFGSLTSISNTSSGLFSSRISNTSSAYDMSVNRLFSYSGQSQSASASLCILKSDNTLFCEDVGELDVGVAYSDFCQSGRELFGGHKCGITTSGILKCQGNNSLGQLGDGTTFNQSSLQVINSGTNYSHVSCAHGKTCAITNTGVLQCWGSGVLTPTIMDSGVNYSTITVGDYHICGITAAGDLKCWGTNTQYQLGDGTMVARLSPTLIDGGTSYLKVSLSNQHSCAITTTGILKCWGYNNYYQLGTGDTLPKSTPTVIDPGVTYQKISIAGDGVFYANSCGITTTGKLKCWGNDKFGSLGVGTKYELPITRPIGVQAP